MADFLFFQTLIHLWRKLLLLRPPKLLQCFLYLMRVLRARFFHKPPDKGTRGDDPAKPITGRQPEEAFDQELELEDAAACASGRPPVAFLEHDTPWTASIELSSRPASITGDTSRVQVELSTEVESAMPDGAIVDSLSSLHSRFKDKTLYPTLENGRYDRKICLYASGIFLLTVLTLHYAQTKEARWL